VRIGVDLGTTRTIVAVADRGNYPVVGFQADGGDLSEHVPTVSAEVGGRLVHGHEAEEAARRGAPHLRSWKRLLGRSGPEARVRIGAIELTLVELMTDFLAALDGALRKSANLPRAAEGPFEAVVSVPANAHSSQRFATLEGFRRAGFEVRAMINEPSAAAIEYAHRYRGSLNKRRDHVCVYDLGGGTFDAALVLCAEDHHEVIDTSGVQELGGDDFDAALMEMALEALDVHPYEVPDDLRAVLDECRAAKESIGPNTRRIALELDSLGDRAPAEPLTIDVASYYERVRPLVERTIEALSEVMAPSGASEVQSLKAAAAETGVAGVYVVGGASGLPIVPRELRERFARRVHRSVYPAAATAIGLAIAADTAATKPVLERFTRHFGVFRERDEGSAVTFDSVFRQGTAMPAAGEASLAVERRYRAAHNVGHFRFVECASLGAGDEPRGDITPHATIRFPFARELRGGDLAAVPIARRDGPGPTIEERYEVDGAGVVSVTIRDLDDGYAERFVL
jgi:molecular chaperone DnaK (HSP70)